MEMTMGQPLTNLGPLEIQQYQKNRYPLFFVDGITEVMPGKSAKGFKLFTLNEWFFPAHFEDDPNVPGTVQIEILIQVFLMTFLTIPEHKGQKTSDAALNNVKFKRRIVPGERLDVEATLDSFKRGLAIGKAVSFVNGEAACSFDLVVTIPEIMTQFRPKT